MLDVTPGLAQLRTELLRRQQTDIPPTPITIKNPKKWPPDYPAIEIWRERKLAEFEENPAMLVGAKAYYASNPIDFINHWCDTYDPRHVGTDKLTWMPFILFKRQEEMVKFIMACLNEEQPGLIEKCRTMGATWVCVAVSVWLWLFWPGISVGWGSQKAEGVDVIGNPSSIFEKIRMLINRIPKAFLPKDLRPEHLKQNNCINPENGSTIIGQVGDNIGRGGRTRIYFKDESAHYERPELIEAALSETTRVPIDISSVNGLGNLFHRKREAGMDWYPGAEIERGYVRVFVMDWRDHPEYDQAWYDAKRLHHTRQGTPHIFAQEIERNYSAAVEGVIIPAEWVEAAIDAHTKLGIPEDGPWGGGLDVADAGGDTNALVLRKGMVLKRIAEWGERDIGVTTRRALQEVEGLGAINIQYDATSIGSAVKAEHNRLLDEQIMPKGVRLVPWMPGGKVLHPAERVVPDDDDSPRNKDFYTNLKAQGWWELRARFYRTWQAVKEGVKFDPDELISLDPNLGLLRKAQKELSQATASKGSKMKLVVDKAPEGTRSPNIADAIVMAYWPMPVFFSEYGMPGMGPKVFVEGKAV